MVRKRRQKNPRNPRKAVMKTEECKWQSGMKYHHEILFFPPCGIDHELLLIEN